MIAESKSSLLAPGKRSPGAIGPLRCVVSPLHLAATDRSGVAAGSRPDCDPQPSASGWRATFGRRGSGRLTDSPRESPRDATHSRLPSADAVVEVLLNLTADQTIFAVMY